MGCVYVTHLRLTNSDFNVLCARMNHLKAHLMLSSRLVVSRGLRLIIQFEYFFPDKKAKWRIYDVRNFKWFTFGMKMLKSLRTFSREEVFGTILPNVFLLSSS